MRFDNIRLDYERKCGEFYVFADKYLHIKKNAVSNRAAILKFNEYPDRTSNQLRFTLQVVYKSPGYNFRLLCQSFTASELQEYLLNEVHEFRITDTPDNVLNIEIINSPDTIVNGNYYTSNGSTGSVRFLRDATSNWGNVVSWSPASVNTTYDWNIDESQSRCTEYLIQRVREYYSNWINRQ